jgi:superfamily II DNA or RNA helicase
MSSIISQRGYSIAKKDVDKSLLSHYKTRLTVTPKVERQEYAHLVEPIIVYQETEQRLYMPRFFGLNEIGAPAQDKLWSQQFSHNPNLVFQGKLRPDQLGVSDVTIKSLRERGGGVIAIECGGGKTTVSLQVSCILNELLDKPSSILVAPEKAPPHFCIGVVCHTTSMMKQWYERIKQYVPAARIGIVQRDQLQIVDKDIIIMSVKTIAQREFSKHAFENIGLIIWDEIHLMCTRTFSLAFPKLASKYTLGLSATPYRKDQCETIFQSYIGPVVYMRKRGKDDTIEARCITYLMQDIEVTYNRFQKVDYTTTTVTTINRPERTEWLAQYVAELGSAGRNVLVLGEYVTHLKTLLKRINELRPVKPVSKHIIDEFLSASRHIFPPEIGQHIAQYMVQDVTAGLYIGEMKNEQRKISEDKDIILGTYKLASVGMDIPALNTLVMASPRKEIEQSVGRILRKKHGDDDDIKPLIIDVIDNHTLYQSQSRERKKFYNTYGYNIIYQQINQDGTLKSTRLMKGAAKKTAAKPKKTATKPKKTTTTKAKKAIKVVVEQEDEEQENEDEEDCLFDESQKE